MMTQGTNSAGLEQQQLDREVARMYDLYGLGDNITEISFNLLDASSPELSLTFSRTSPSTRLTPKPDDHCFSLHGISSTEDFMTPAWINSMSSNGVFAHPGAQLPDKLMYTPTQYTGERLAFPDYMMVHSHSGMPVLSDEQPTTITSNMPYGASFYYINQDQDRESSQSVCLETPRRIACRDQCISGHLTRDGYACSESDSKSDLSYHMSTRPTKRKIPAKARIPPRKRGRPRKVAIVNILPNPAGVTELADEKENQPGSRKQTAVEYGDMVTPADEEDDLDEMTEELAGGPFYETTECQVYPKPPYSYSALVTLALKNSKSGRLTVRDIYNFMCNHFPYFRTAPAGWKNSVRHNLSLNPAFLKILGDSGPARARTACRWTMNPDRYRKMNDEIGKFRGKALTQITCSMRNSDLLKALEEGTFSDFTRAIKGVTIQEKKAGQRRRKMPKKKELLQHELGGRAATVAGMLKNIKDDSSVDGSTYLSGTSLPGGGKVRSPLTPHPSSPALLNFSSGYHQSGSGAGAAPVYYSRLRSKVLDGGCWDMSDPSSDHASSENCHLEYSS